MVCSPGPKKQERLAWLGQPFLVADLHLRFTKAASLRQAGRQNGDESGQKRYFWIFNTQQFASVLKNTIWFDFS